KGISVFCDLGFQIPPAYGKTLLKAPSNYYGAVVRKSSDNPGLMVQDYKNKLTEDHLNKINKTFEGVRIIHFLGQIPENTPADSLQPMKVLYNSTGDVVIAATLVGDFDSHMPQVKQTSQTSEWWCVNQKIVPKMQRLWRLCKEDPNALNEELKTMENEFIDLI